MSPRARLETLRERFYAPYSPGGRLRFQLARPIHRWNRETLVQVHEAIQNIWDAIQADENQSAIPEIHPLKLQLDNKERTWVRSLSKANPLDTNAKRAIDPNDDGMVTRRPIRQVLVFGRPQRYAGIFCVGKSSILVFPQRDALVAAGLDSDQRLSLLSDRATEITPVDSLGHAFGGESLFRGRFVECVLRLSLYPPEFRIDETGSPEGTVRIGVRFFDGSVAVDDDPFEISPAGFLRAQALKGFIRHLLHLISSNRPQIEYTKNDTHIFIKGQRHALNNIQHAFVVTLIEMASANGNKKIRDRDIQAQVTKNIGLGVFSHLGSPDVEVTDQRMHYVMRTGARWRTIILKVGRGLYKINPKYMIPAPKEIS